MLSGVRLRRWTFSLDGTEHKVEARLQVGRCVQLTVDGEVLEWPQTWLDVLDFGGRFAFELHAATSTLPTPATPAHECWLVINTLNMYLFVDGVDIESGRRRSGISTGRGVFRIVAFILVALVFYMNV